MNNKTSLRSPWKTLFLSLAAGLLLSALWIPSQRVVAQPPQALLQQYIEPFLYPPYPGTASEEAVFDHASPDYSQTDNRMIAFTGDQANKYCPNPQPSGSPPSQTGVCDAGSGLYWSYSLGDWLSYNGHDGIDYGVQYRPLYAAADADQVVYAGWQDPMNHRYALGIYVKLHHPNGYGTTYGHMSTLAIQSCATPGCASIPHGELIGYSGNTGNSTGPHLHFNVNSPANKSVDPYGWTGESSDPWPYNQRNSLWVQYPSVVPYYGSTVSVLPTGAAALPFTLLPASSLMVDDGGPGFSELPTGCWTVAATSIGQSENSSMRFIHPVIYSGATCTARWNFPSGQPPGLYTVYVRIPAIHASSEGALYTIVHAGRSNSVTINQKAYPNPYHVTDGWLYIGKYDFAASGNEYVSLPNRTQDIDSAYQTVDLAVDAVRFASVVNVASTSTPTLTNTIRPPSTPSPTDTLGPTITPTPTLLPTDTRIPAQETCNTSNPCSKDIRWPTRTRAFTPTLPDTQEPLFTPTSSSQRAGSESNSPSPTYPPTNTWTPAVMPDTSPTRTPSITRTPSQTRWPSATLPPTDTRWPTKTSSPHP